MKLVAISWLLILGLAACSSGLTTNPSSPLTTNSRQEITVASVAVTPCNDPELRLRVTEMAYPDATCEEMLELLGLPTPTPIKPPSASSTDRATVQEREADPGQVLPSPTSVPPAPDSQAISKTGLLATIPDYATLDLKQVGELIEAVYPGRAPRNIQLLLLLTQQDEAYLVVALDTGITGFISAGTVVGEPFPFPKELPPELDFTDRVIVTDNLTLMEPIKVTPEEVNQNPQRYAFKRVTMDTTYLLSSVRLKDPPPSLDHIGFGQATNQLGSSSRDAYLTVIDTENTETQVRVANLTGTVLYPTAGARALLDRVYRFAPEDVREALDRPSLFYETLKDDPAQTLLIHDLFPRLSQYHGEMVSIQGIALGSMVRTEDIQQLKNMPVHLTLQGLGVVDLSGAMPLFGISSGNDSGTVFGNYRFNLSVYGFGGTTAFAFLLGKQAVPLDPISDVEMANFGDRIKTTLEGFLVANPPTIQLSEGLTLQEVDLLIPTDPSKPIIMTRDPRLVTGDSLSSVEVDGFLLDSASLGLGQYGSKVIVVKEGNITYQRSVPTAPPVPTVPAGPAASTPMPEPVSAPTPVPEPTPAPTPTVPAGPLPPPGFP